MTPAEWPAGRHRKEWVLSCMPCSGRRRRRRFNGRSTTSNNRDPSHAAPYTITHAGAAKLSSIHVCMRQQASKHLARRSAFQSTVVSSSSDDGRCVAVRTRGLLHWIACC